MGYKPSHPEDKVLTRTEVFQVGIFIGLFIGILLSHIFL
jgi:hypothetical protein